MTTEREFCAWVWCACWLSCRGIGVPGFDGGGHAMLCTACEAERLADENPVTSARTWGAKTLAPEGSAG